MSLWEERNGATLADLVEPEVRKLVVTGSRDISPAGIVYAARIVRRAKELGWLVGVGDADGVDLAVIRACDKIEVPVTVHGAYGKVRNETRTGANKPLDMTYLERNDLMAEACDICIAIWNGESNGTRYTFSKARELGKEVHVKVFK